MRAPLIGVTLTPEEAPVFTALRERLAAVPDTHLVAVELPTYRLLVDHLRRAGEARDAERGTAEGFVDRRIFFKGVQMVPDFAGCAWCGCQEQILGGEAATHFAPLGLGVCRDCASRGVDDLEQHICRVCGLPIAVGEQPCVFRVIAHAPVLTYHPFTSYFDFALGAEVTSLAQRKRLMREQHLDYRDKMSKGDLSARLDRVTAERKERAR